MFCHRVGKWELRLGIFLSTILLRNFYIRGRMYVLWLLADFYSHPDVSKRRVAWNLLSLLKPSIDQLWCVIGVFNKIVTQVEKVGGRPRPEA